MEESYDLKKLLFLILRKIWLVIICAVLGATAFFCYSKFYLPLEYSSHISMYVQSYKNINTNNSNNYNDISNSKQLINTYIEVLKDDAVMRTIGEQLIDQYGYDTISEIFKMEDDNVNPSSLCSSISITTVTDTSALKVVATTKNADISASICNIMAEIAPSFIKNAVGVGDLKIIDTAKSYYTPVSPNTLKNVLIGIVVGVVLAVLIIFVIDILDNTIKDSKAVNEKYHKPIIGEIQQFGNSNKKKGSNYEINILSSNIPFNVIENYKLLRTNIMFSLSTGNNKVFAISSSNPSEGKSTSSINIAIAFAQAKQKILLIDADMRKSVIHKSFLLPNESGLSTVIGNMTTFEDTVCKNVIENLDVLTAGPSVPNPSELLASQNFKNIIESIMDKYDYVLIDTPPINVVSDALTIKNSVAGLMLVVKYGSTTYDDIENCMKKMEVADMNMLGFIFNNINIKDKNGYYKQYSYYESNKKK